MSFQINCPYCDEKIISDVCEGVEDSSGQWNCNNGHIFTLEFAGKLA